MARTYALGCWVRALFGEMDEKKEEEEGKNEREPFDMSQADTHFFEYIFFS